MLILLLCLIVVVAARLSSNEEKNISRGKTTLYEMRQSNLNMNQNISGSNLENIKVNDTTNLYSEINSISASNMLILLSVVYSLYINNNMGKELIYNQDSSQNIIPIFNNYFHYSFTFNIIHSFLLILVILIISLSTFPYYHVKTKDLESPPKNIHSTFSQISNIYPWLNNINIASNKLYEYKLIILFNILGACFLVLSNNLLSFFLNLELQSYSLYILSTINRDSQNATAAGLKYFLLGGLSSAIILLGSALIYVSTGLWNFENIIYILLSEFSWSSTDLGFILILVGLFFKVSAAPFHFWSPDVYSDVPTLVTTYIAILPKVSLLIFMLSIVLHSIYSISVFSVLIVSSMLSLIIGSLLGLTQINIKRLFAYSSINNIGLLLLALSINSFDSIQAFVFYLLQYTLTNLNGFIILLAFGVFFNIASLDLKNKIMNQTKKDWNFEKSLDKYSPLLYIYQLKGQFYLNPFLTWSLAITLFSFIGIPPLLGFFGKLWILITSLNQGYVFFATLIILTSVLSGAYYLKIIQTMISNINQPLPENEKESNPGTDFFSNYLLKKPDENLKISKSLNKISSLQDIKKDKNIMSVGNHSIYRMLWMQEGYASIYISNIMTSIISILTLVILLYILLPTFFLNMTYMIVSSLIN